MPVTQKEIADHVGLSRISVARALNGYSNVPQRTRERIEDAARVLGYGAHSNREARVMAGKRHGRKLRSDILAVLMPTAFFEGRVLSDVPFFAPLIKGIEEEAGKRGMDVLLCTPHEGKMPKLVQNGGVDGVIALPNFPPAVRELSLPVVLYGANEEGRFGIAPDNAKGARLSARHLIELGHKRIAFLGFAEGANYAAADERVASFRRTLKAADLPLRAALIVADISSPTTAAGAEAMTRVLASEEKFSAVVCSNDLIAMGAIGVLQTHGLQVPDDISVIGFDDVSEQYAFAPALTTIAFDRHAMGKCAVELIGEALEAEDNGEQPITRNEKFPVELIVRESTAQHG